MEANTPSMVMYAMLKRFGMSNREAALFLLNTKLTFDGRMIQERVDESSQLSRRIVRTRPGELAIGLFNNFALTCPRIAARLAEQTALKSCGGDLAKANRALVDLFSTTLADEMCEALTACGVDDFMYRNMVTYVNHVELTDESGRAVLHVMLFIVTGCVGSPNTASLLTVDYATQFLGADYQTAPTVIGNEPDASSTDGAGVGLGLVRMVDGRIKAGTRMHVVHPDGTELGLLPRSKHMVNDVGEDVSRRHALLWRERGRWLLKDIGSTNGTFVVRGSMGDEVALEPNGASCEVRPTDTICLGATTRFLVMPVLEP